MDISVSRLNNRMVLQVPPELPLGLVFVVGQVHNLNDSRDNAQPMHFDLVEAGYRLRCQLSSRVANDVFLQEGDMVRAGGHLAFDTQAARYFLLARDLEIVPDISSESRSKMVDILVDVQKRAEAANLVRTELPQWVKNLAPPEVQEELGLIEGRTGEAEPPPAGIDTLEPGTDLLAPVVDMSDEMLAFLSEAIDRNEDVELTPEVLAQFIPLETQSVSPTRAPAGSPPSDLLPPAVSTTRPAAPPPATPLPEASPPAATQPAVAQPAVPEPAPTKEAPAQPAPRPAPAQPPRSSSNNTVQNLLLIVIGILLMLLIVVITLIGLNYFQII